MKWQPMKILGPFINIWYGFVNVIVIDKIYNSGFTNFLFVT